MGGLVFRIDRSRRWRCRAARVCVPSRPIVESAFLAKSASRKRLSLVIPGRHRAVGPSSDLQGFHFQTVLSVSSAHFNNYF